MTLGLRQWQCRSTQNCQMAWWYSEVKNKKNIKKISIKSLAFYLKKLFFFLFLRGSFNILKTCLINYHLLVIHIFQKTEKKYFFQMNILIYKWFWPYIFLTALAFCSEIHSPFDTMILCNLSTSNGFVSSQCHLSQCLKYLGKPEIKVIKFTFKKQLFYDYEFMFK